MKYSTLLERFIAPFINDFDTAEYYEDVFEFAIEAWNIGNMKLVLPEHKSDEIVNSVSDPDIDMNLLKRMIDYKVSHFKEYTNFVVDFEIKETNSAPVLTVITQEKDVCLTKRLKEIEAEFEATQTEFEENYINRTAIIIKPLQPFLDWCSNLYPDAVEEMKETKIYLNK